MRICLWTTRRYREAIELYRQDYLGLNGFEPTDIAAFRQITDYESVKMEASYLNAISNNFGEVIRAVMNKIMGL